MEATRATLLALARAKGSLRGGEDDVFVWWGKIASPNRQQPLEHLPSILALDPAADANDDAPVASEVQLYLTDYRSLYVAHVAEVVAWDPRADDDEARHVPPGVYPYTVACDCWFRLWDVRRVVLDDTRAVVDELRKLRNARYHGRPVSLYGGMVELPLLVTRPDGARWFDEHARRLTDDRLWVEFDAELSGVHAVAASLRDDVLGESAWSALDPAARTFVANAEQIYRAHRADSAFDFSQVAVNLAKAYEVQLAVLLGRLRSRVPEHLWLVNVDGRSRHLLDDPPGLGAVARALGEPGAVRTAAQQAFDPDGGQFLTVGLPAILRELAPVRNAGAHREAVRRDVARDLRDRHLGVGGLGVLVELGRVRARG